MLNLSPRLLKSNSLWWVIVLNDEIYMSVLRKFHSIPNLSIFIISKAWMAHVTVSKVLLYFLLHPRVPSQYGRAHFYLSPCFPDSLRACLLKSHSIFHKWMWRTRFSSPRWKRTSGRKSGKTTRDRRRSGGRRNAMNKITFENGILKRRKLRGSLSFDRFSARIVRINIRFSPTSNYY